jgi:diacylglycerol kinase family enzyme
MGGFLLINPRSGKGRPDASELRAEAERLGITTHVLAAEDDPAELARAGDGPLGVAGGDGSLAGVAEVAVERDVPFVVVPFGTRNHFARDLGLDRDDPLAALSAFSGREERIDVGRANGRLFLNNVSLGLYARLVHRREGRDALAGVKALGLLLRRPRGLGVSIDRKRVHARVVLVSNNRYELDLFSLGERERLDEGRLHLYAAHGVLRSTWEERSAERFTIDVSSRFVNCAVDGEPAELPSPLELEIEPRALRLLLPRAPGG